MPYTPYPIDRAGGLNLADDPEEVGPAAATSLQNVDVDQRGRVRVRDGYESFGDALAAGSVQTTVAYGTEFLLARNGDLISFASTGTATNVGTIPSNCSSTAKLGTATAEYVFFAGSGTLARRYNGAALANSVGRPVYLGVTPVSNRLVQANFGTTAAFSPTGANGSPSTVFFSDPGAPETFSANNYVLLHPGDKDEIVGVASWRELLFVFKQGKVFVFTGESTGVDGNPVFNYRAVDLPSRHLGGSFGTVAGEDGVYFQALDGIYRTTGDVPVRVSGAIDPIFNGTADSSLLVDSADPYGDLSYANGRLFMSYTNEDGDERLLVWDRRLDAWLLWRLHGSTAFHTPPIVWPLGATADLYFARSGALNKWTPGATDDDGTAIVSHYQSGVYELGQAGADAYTRYTRLWGSGSPTVSVFTNHGSSDSLAASVTLGTAPAVDEGYHNASYKGRWFQHKLSASSGVWNVSRVTHDVAWVRP